MAEVVGVVASASQLAAVCLSLVELLGKIKGAEALLQKYQQQLQDLRVLSGYISENPLLRASREVEHYTTSLLLLIDDSQLNCVLRKNRFSRTLYLLQREKDLQETFATLERQKTSLSLVVEHIQACALYNIQAGVDAMTSKQEHTAAGFVPHGSNTGFQHPIPPNPEDDSKQVSVANSGSGQLVQKNFFELPVSPSSDDGAERTEARYDGCTAFGGNQCNGFSYVGPREPWNNIGDYNLNTQYIGCDHDGPGHQINGFNLRFTDNAPIESPQFTATNPPRLPRAIADWKNCRFTNDNWSQEGVHTANLGTQFNGTRMCCVEPAVVEDVEYGGKLTPAQDGLTFDEAKRQRHEGKKRKHDNRTKGKGRGA